MSLNRDTYQFFIQPWEYPGAKFDVRPDAVTTLKVMGRERVFLLKIREGRVYFRWPGRTKAEWALTVLMPETEKDLIGFWRQQVEQGNFGRYVVLIRGYDAFFSRKEIQELYGQQLHRDFDVCPMNVLQRTVVSFIVRADGAVWAREWCSETWQELPPKPGIFEDKPDAIWNPANQLKGLRRRGRDIGKVLALRVVPPGELVFSNRVQWLRGSQAEVSRLVRLCFIAYNFETRTKPVKISIPTLLPLAPEMRVDSTERRDHCQFENPEIQFYSGLLDFITWWYIPVRLGQRPQVSTLRIHTGFHRYRTSITLQPSLPRTEEERTHAIAELDKWLKGKVSNRVRKQLVTHLR